MWIFLDIDGVMVPAKSWKNPELLDDGFPAFSKKAVNVLQSLISEDVTMILTTSHKMRFSIEQWKSIFQKRSLAIPRIRILDSMGNSRKEEILNWFAENRIDENFLILDDDKTLNSLPPFLKDRLVKTSSHIGLTEEHLAKIETFLGQRLAVA